MIPDDRLYEKIQIFHRFRQDGNLLEITPEVVLESSETTTLIASYFVDSFEMIESARFSVEKGANTLPFRQKVKIINPLIWNPHTLGEPALYELKTVFYKNGRAHFLIVQMTGLRETKLERVAGEYFLTVNGKKMLCHYYDFSAAFSKEKIKHLSRKYKFDFTILKGVDPNCEDILDLCDRTGIAVALDLTNMDKKMFEKLSHHPSICLHTAEKGVLSAFAPDFPFLSLDKIKNSLIRQYFKGEE